MHVIRARNPQQALPEALRLLDREGLTNDANMLVVGEPVTTVYIKPRETASFWDVAGPCPARYLLDGLLFLSTQMTDVSAAMSTVRNGRGLLVPAFDGLDTCMRTNSLGELDAVTFSGQRRISLLYGPDVVADSLLQQFVAAAAGVPVGKLWHICFRFSGRAEYRDHPAFRETSRDRDPYHAGYATTFPLVSIDPEQWLAELRMFVDEGDRAMGYTDPFFRRVALPLLRAQRFIEDRTTKNRLDAAGREIARCGARDWQLACLAWINKEVELGSTSKEPTA